MNLRNYRRTPGESQLPEVVPYRYTFRMNDSDVLLKRKRRVRRLFGLAILILAAVWFCDRHFVTDRMVNALSPDAAAVAYVSDLSREYGRFYANPVVRDTLRTLGVDPDAAEKDGAGIHWLLRFMTGAHSLFSLELLPGGEVRVCGASTVGWRRPVLAAIEAMGFLPGVGKFERTEKGVQYLRFSRTGPVLSFILQGGVLLACWGETPDTVLEMQARYERGTGVAPGEPIPAVRHLAWSCVNNSRKGPICVALRSDPELAAFRFPADGAWSLPEGELFLTAQSLAEDELRVALRLRCPSLAEGVAGSGFDGLEAKLPVPLSATTAFVAGGTEVLTDWMRLGAGLPFARTGASALWLTDTEHGGALSFLRIPALCGLAPAVEPDRLQRWYQRAGRDAYWSETPLSGLRLSPKAQDNGAVLLLRPKTLEFLGRTPDKDCWFVLTEGPDVAFGTAWGSWRNVRGTAKEAEPTVGGTLARLAAEAADAERRPSLAFWADTGKIVPLVRNSAAILELGARFGLHADEAQTVREGLDKARTLSEAAAALGVLEGTAEKDDAGWLLHLRATGRKGSGEVAP